MFSHRLPRLEHVTKLGKGYSHQELHTVIGSFFRRGKWVSLPIASTDRIDAKKFSATRAKSKTVCMTVWPLRILRIIVGCMLLGCPMQVSAQSTGQPLLLPDQPFDYVDYAVNNLPAHFAAEIARDSTPANNPITDAGATLGRVLFYETRLSHNNTMSCSSCHFQENGFSDPAPMSEQVDGNLTERHSLALVNTQFFGDGFLSGRALSDVSAPTLEAQALLPITSSELGIGALGDANIDVALGKLTNTSFYEPLFLDAFGQAEEPGGNVITTERLANALGQFVRSLVSYNSKFDTIFDANGNEDPALVAAAFTAQEQLGKQLFHGKGQCANCHQGNTQSTLQVHNNGLDATTIDPGAGDGLFKSVSLRNVEVRGSFMHDGRFSSLEEVVEFYSTGIQDHPDLDFRLRENQDRTQGPLFIDFTEEESAALVAFLETLTDQNFLTDERFSDPFVITCDFDDDRFCGADDLNLLLAEGPIALGVPTDISNELYDLNGDGTLDAADVELWLADAAGANGLPSAYEFGDANLDGIVNTDDFLAWNVNRFTADTAWDAGDFNGDGFVDVSDFNIWNVNRTPGTPPQQVPEPSAGLLLILCLLPGLVAFRKNHVA